MFQRVATVNCPLTSVFCPRSSTTVEDPLQISSFCTNKANFPVAQMNVNKVLTKDYENETLGQRGKNKPNSKPIQTQSNPIKANKMPKQTQYKPNTNPIKPNTNPIKPNLLNAQMNVMFYSTKDYENETLGKRGKNKPNTNPIKPNFVPLVLFIVYNSAKVKIEKEFCL